MKYNNLVPITSGRKLVVQQPFDDRQYFDTINDVVNSIANDSYYSWYDLMAVYIKEIHEFAIWLDVNNLPPGIAANSEIPLASV